MMTRIEAVAHWLLAWGTHAPWREIKSALERRWPGLSQTELDKALVCAKRLDPTWLE